jgi:HSP20 family protein
MHRLFGDFFGGRLTGFWDGDHQGFLPAVDVRETEDRVVLEAELPGVNPKDVEIQVEGDCLLIRGERKHEKDEKTKSYHRLERAHGRFERRFTLPEGTNSEKVEATYKNGVLTVEVPKKEEARPRTIQVQAK